MTALEGFTRTSFSSRLVFVMCNAVLVLNTAAFALTGDEKALLLQQGGGIAVVVVSNNNN